ncbi:YbaK/EbsC family protein, partial [Streptomyces celluloflavus]
MPVPMDAFDEVRPATACLDLLTEPVAAAIRGWRGSVPVEEIRYVDTDPAIADTDALVAHHRRGLRVQTATV